MAESEIVNLKYASLQLKTDEEELLKAFVPYDLATGERLQGKATRESYKGKVTRGKVARESYKGKATRERLQGKGYKGLA